MFQQPDEFESYGPTKERVIAMTEAKLAVKSPDEIGLDKLTGTYEEEHNEEGGVYCYCCGGQGHIAAKFGPLEPQKGGKWKGGPNGGGKDGKRKGKSKGKGKGAWIGFCI